MNDDGGNIPRDGMAGVNEGERHDDPIHGKVNGDSVKQSFDVTACWVRKVNLRLAA
jgi:hypothetical protein